MKKILAILVASILFASAAPTFAQTVVLQNVTPAEAYTLATTYPNVYILDVRTPEEWTWVGHPGANKLGDGASLNGKVVNIPIKKYIKGVMALNPTFLRDVAGGFGKANDVVLITMCRSGDRSVLAANTLLGSASTANITVYNMLTGFEGSADSSGYRTKNGWKVNGLPYTFSGPGYTD